MIIVAFILFLCSMFYEFKSSEISRKIRNIREGIPHTGSLISHKSLRRILKEEQIDDELKKLINEYFKAYYISAILLASSILLLMISWGI